MKRIILILLFSVLLISCAAPAQSELPTVTVTSTPTPPPTLTPTATETPMPTKDPNAPPEYSRFENGVYYLDKQTENNNTLTYEWNQERSLNERQYFSAPLWDAPPGASDLFQLSVFIDESIEGEINLPTLTHTENNDPYNAQNFYEFFKDTLLTELGNDNLIPDRHSILMDPMWNGSHAWHFDFNTKEGAQSWGIWGPTFNSDWTAFIEGTTGTTISVHIRGDYDQLKADMDTNGFSEAKSNNTYGPVNYYMVRIRTENGNMTLDIAPSLRPATAWTQKQIMEMFMFAPAAAMEQGPDLTNPQSAGLVSIFVLNQEAYPLFEMGPPQ